MRNPFALALAALTLVAVAASDVPIPTPQGFVTDLAGVLDPDVRARLTRLLEELQAKTGAEIAVVTVDTTQPLDDFTYALRIAEAWKPGRKGEDTGIVFLVAVRDRKLRILVGYGLEGILPDGLVGAIEDEEVVPAFRAGQVGEGVWRGVVALAARIATARGVALTGIPPPRAAPPPPSMPSWLALLVLGLLVFGVMLPLMLYGSRGARRVGRGGFYPYGGFGGGFGGGGGGFRGFGGGSFGGGGAGRGW